MELLQVDQDVIPKVVIKTDCWDYIVYSYNDRYLKDAGNLDVFLVLMPGVVVKFGDFNPLDSVPVSSIYMISKIIFYMVILHKWNY